MLHQLYGNSVMVKDHMSNTSYFQDTKSVQRKTKIFNSRHCRPDKPTPDFHEQEEIDFNVPKSEILLHNICSLQKYT